MKIILTIAGICWSLVSLAQSPQQNLQIQISYEKAGRYEEQAIETIEAVNIVGMGTTVDYTAGQSVALLPGFEAKAGSVFTAEIKPVTGKREVSLQLKAFPNPFEESTTIQYTLPADGKVTVWVIDLQGKVVDQLLKGENQAAGEHKLEWKPKAVPVGVYNPIVEVDNQRVIGRLVKQ